MSLPRSSSTKGDEPLRRLGGAIGPALREAGILTDKADVNASGRFVHFLDDAGVSAQRDAYEDALKEFVRRLFTQAELVRKRNSDEATRLWRDA